MGKKKGNMQSGKNLAQNKQYKLREGRERKGAKTRGMKGTFGKRWRVHEGKTGKLSITLTNEHCTLFRWMSQGHTETLSHT